MIASSQTRHSQQAKDTSPSSSLGLTSGATSWLVGLMAFDVFWVGGNGLTLLECPPPCSALHVYADTLHLGSLLLAPLATYVAYRAMRRMSGPGNWQVMVGNVIIMLAFVFAIVALLTSLASA